MIYLQFATAVLSLTLGFLFTRLSLLFLLLTLLGFSLLTLALGLLFVGLMHTNLTGVDRCLAICGVHPNCESRNKLKLFVDDLHLVFSVGTLGALYLIVFWIELEAATRIVTTANHLQTAVAEITLRSLELEIHTALIN